MGNTKTTIYLPDELREKLFIERARTNKPIKEIIIEALDKYFEEKEDAEKTWSIASKEKSRGKKISNR